MRERERGGVIDVFARGRVVPAIRAERPDRPIDHYVRPMAKDVGLDAYRRDETGLSLGDLHIVDGGDRLGERARKVVVGAGELVHELVVAALERRVSFGDEDALIGVADALHVDAEAEAVEQLRPELALLGVHRADEDEARWMQERHTLALDDVDTHRRGVEQYIDDVVVQEVDLVDVEDVAVGLREDAGLEALRAATQGRLDVDGADHPVLRRVDGQLDDPHLPRVRRQLPVLRIPEPAVGAQRLAVVGIAAEVAAFDDRVLGQQLRQRAHGGGLAGALLAADEHPADRRLYGVEDQRQLHRLLADDGSEREGVPVQGRRHVQRIGVLHVPT